MLPAGQLDALLAESSYEGRGQQPLGKLLACLKHHAYHVTFKRLPIEGVLMR
jgi:hypothetical protein